MKITSKGQVTIPQHIRERCGLAPGTEIEFVLEDGEVFLKRIDQKKDSIRGWLDRVTGTGTSGMTTDEHMAMTRGEDQ